MDKELLVENRDVVVPGQDLAQGLGYLPGPGTYREDDKIRASRVGLVSIDGKVIKLIRLSGVYQPRVGDKVVAQVIDVLLSGWRVNFACSYSGVLSTKDVSTFIPRGKDLTEYYELGDYILTKIVNVTSQKLVDVTMRGSGFRKLVGGRIIRVSPQKIPRIVGKEGTMIAMLRGSTGCDIVSGQNGLIWVNGSPEDEILVEQAIRMIEEEAHMPGLTDRIKAFLQEHGKEISSKQEERSDDYDRGDRGDRPRFERRDRPRFDGGSRDGGRPPRSGGRPPHRRHNGPPRHEGRREHNQE